MDRWRGTLLQLACVAAVVVLGSTPSPDRELKILALAIVGMIGGAAVTRGKLDALAQQLGPGSPAGAAITTLAALAHPSAPPPPAPPATTRRMLDLAWSWAVLVVTVLVGVAFVLGALGCAPGTVERHNVELGTCHVQSVAMAKDAGSDAARDFYKACADGVNARHGVTP